MLQNCKGAINSGVEDGSSTSGSGVRTYSVFNTKDYNNVVFGTNKSSKDKSETKNEFIRISKLMKLSQVNASSAHSSVVLKNVLSADGDVNVEAGTSGEPNISKVRYCSACKTAFDNQTDQRQHYKLDWHRYNIKLNIKQKQSVTEERFTQIMDEKNDKADNDDDDVSSISGSESDTSSDSDDEKDVKDAPKITSATAIVGNKAKVIFENKNGNIVTFYKRLFSINKTKVNDDANINNTDAEELTESDYINTVNQLPDIVSKSKWLIIMIGGGHFAAAVFKGSEPILHKTFHCYTVRAKQGGSQSMKDNKRATAAKSAGASLRRYNEQSLLQHVQDILSSWSNDLTDCQLLYYRAVGPSNRSILFGGKQPPLDKNDPRLSTIPFQTRRATYSEVKRVHSLLASVYVYENEEAFKNAFQFNKQQQNLSSGSNVSPKKTKTEETKTNRASKQRQSPTRDIDDEEITVIVNRMRLESSSSDQATEYYSTTNDENISFSESLEEFGNSPVPKIGKLGGTVTNISNENNTESNKLNNKKKKKKPWAKSEIDKNPVIRKFAKKVFIACVDGDFKALEDIVKEFKGSFDNNQSVKNEESTEVGESRIESQNGDVDKEYENIVPVFNQVIRDGITLLMNAAKNSHKEIIRFLLENGGDPCSRDKKGVTAYGFAPDKDTRNVFRRFMGDFPDKYDYSKSHIPSPLTDSIEKEMADKKRAMKKKKRLKEKERRLADEPRRQEEADQKRFLQLSDREKRALAAERRILKAIGKAAENLALVRCYKCAMNITGKVPFEYNNFVFCSMECLKVHRIGHKTKRI